MSFLEHLGELRKRILWSLIPSLIGLILAFRFSQWIIKFASRPLTKSKVDLISLTPTEAFWTSMKVAMIAGLFLAMPVILWQVWAFVAPGLHKHERKYAGPFIIIGTLLFLLGGAFALLLVMPFSVIWLTDFGQGQGIRAMYSVSSYMDFVIKFTIAFGLIFELPLALTMLSKMGVVTPKFLAQNRKYAVLLNAVLAAVLTPTGDMVNMSLMMVPLVLLYEVGIISARIFGRRATPVPAPVPETAQQTEA
jgi:sec-independent protein translocase protein TatC